MQEQILLDSGISEGNTRWMARAQSSKESLVVGTGREVDDRQPKRL